MTKFFVERWTLDAVEDLDLDADGVNALVDGCVPGTILMPLSHNDHGHLLIVRCARESAAIGTIVGSLVQAAGGDMVLRRQPEWDGPEWERMFKEPEPQ